MSETDPEEPTAGPDGPDDPDDQDGTDRGALRLLIDVVEADPAGDDGPLLMAWLRGDSDLPRRELGYLDERHGMSGGRTLSLTAFPGPAASVEDGLHAVLRSLVNHLSNQGRPLTLRVAREGGGTVAVTSRDRTRGALRRLVAELAGGQGPGAEGGADRDGDGDRDRDGDGGDDRRGRA
ncbi:hypothetical protein FH609_020850 [Streptomyces sp. 3MP-14]|uniref:Uncharacterized protein n=1 Tax=Streptomyces mimosae TaxID=2586635 RepID=A0A5N6A0X4_9ACTN|nr:MULTISPECIES: hypothetical protein [Streptomyces]KAB8161713.1 hypothetical protein FH607_023570 [Streptomyces mimosae]KAB8175019.1 hypothetical protein FH609_020850 [Streptomyces sp. 3MP-14]